MTDEVQEESKKPVVTLYFEVKTFRPDNRQYKQQSLELSPNPMVSVAVQVPLTHKYVHNWEAILSASVDKADDIPATILKPEGLQYVQEQVEKYFRDPEVTPKDFGTGGWKTATAGGDEWGDSPSNAEFASASPDEFFYGTKETDDDDPEWSEDLTGEDWQEDW